MPACDQDQNASLVIHLSDNVVVDAIILSNQEDFSANLDKVQFYGSAEYPLKPDSDWLNLSAITPLPQLR